MIRLENWLGVEKLLLDVEMPDDLLPLVVDFFD